MEKKPSWLDRERKAFDEIKAKLTEHWNADKAKFERLSLENKKLEEVVLEEEAEADRGMVELSRLIHTLWINDPIIFRVITHNVTAPEDIEARFFIRENYLSDDDLKYYRNELSLESVLEDSELAKAYNVKGLPVHLFMAGAVLNDLLRDYHHFRMIDEVKKTGVSESVEELRDTRIKQQGGTVVKDYSPLYKDTLSHKGLLREFFNEDDFIRFRKENYKKVKNEIDDLLCYLIQKTAQDRRLNAFFGDSEKINPENSYRQPTANLKFVVKHRDEETTIPLQLLPKWIGDVLKIAYKYDLNPLDNDKTDEIQAAELGLYKGALAWKGDRIATAYLRMGMSYTLKNTFKESIKEQRKVKEEHSGGSLDDFINPRDGAARRRIEYLSNEDLDPGYKGITPENLNPEEEMMGHEDTIFEDTIRMEALKDKRFMKILKSGGPISVADRQYKSRKIKEILKTLGIEQ